ncbi:MAG TPA: response regulator [Terriglobia bacterium]|nr:response regulator [Terriglobia bacterium]
MTRLLLVEDSTDILFVLQLELEGLGYTVDVAANAKTGIEIARLSHPDVIISDLGLPEEDGFEFIKRIRKTKELATVPAIALTGFSEPSHVQRALALGFTAHLTKPVEPDELANLIEKLTTKRLERKAS